MIELDHPDLPTYADTGKGNIAITIDTNYGDAFSIDPLAFTRIASNPFTVPTILNPDYQPVGYLYRIDKPSTLTIVKGHTWQTARRLYVVVPNRRTVSFNFTSSHFRFPVYNAPSYGLDLAEIVSGAIVSHVSIGGAVYPLGDGNLAQDGDILTFTPDYLITPGTPIVIYGSGTYSEDPYAIVHRIPYQDTEISALVEVQHLAHTYSRSLNDEIQHYQFQWNNQVATLFLPMSWEYTLNNRAKIGSNTIGLLEYGI